MLPDLTIAIMRAIGIILGILSFIGGQVYLHYLLRKLDQFLERRPKNDPSFTYDVSYRYPEDFVVE